MFNCKKRGVYSTKKIKTVKNKKGGDLISRLVKTYVWLSEVFVFQLNQQITSFGFKDDQIIQLIKILFPKTNINFALIVCLNIQFSLIEA